MQSISILFGNMADGFGKIILFDRKFSALDGFHNVKVATVQFITEKKTFSLELSTTNST